MKNRPKKSEAAMLAQWNTALTNAQTQPEIAKQTRSAKSPDLVEE